MAGLVNAAEPEDAAQAAKFRGKKHRIVRIRKTRRTKIRIRNLP